MEWLKYFDYHTYEYEDKHAKEFIKDDSRISGLLCLTISLFMGAILLFVFFNPETRYDSGMDNIPKLVITIFAGLIGYILSIVPIQSEKIWLLERRFVRFYLSILFLVLMVYELYASSAKADAIFIYLIYCVTAVVILHVNPIVYLIQNIIAMVVILPVAYTYFNSLGTLFTLFALFCSLCYLVFFSNLKVHRQLVKADRQLMVKQQLEDELRERTAEVMLGMRRQTAIQENVILAIADLVENRDMDTGTHIKATSYYAKVIARNCVRLGYYNEQLSEESIKLIEKAAPMHDLGKIIVPDYILKAPRRLTEDEFEIMKTHALEGARIIKHIYADIESPEYINYASNIAHYHHEKWNGTGYPEGKVGYDIPLEARIMAIADVFDALVSKRCYKDAYPLCDAFDEIERGAGTHFDPKLVEAFLLSRKTIEQMILCNFE